MFLDETIDPDIPTDPNDLALYKRYGRNWRNVVMGSTVRDRGGNFDRGMRFMHSTPEGFMQRPNMQSTQQVQQSNIDQSGFFAQMQKLQDEYNKALQDYYSYMSTPQYNQMQDYYAGNYQDYYGGGSESQEPQYSFAPETTAATANTTAAPAAAATTGITGAGGLTGGAGGVPAAPVLMPKLMPNQPATRGGDSLFGGYGSQRAAPAAPTYSNVQTQYQRNVDDGKVKAPAPAPAPAAAAAAPTMSDQFIARYERAEATGNDNPKVKTVEPVKAVVKPATSFKTSKGNVARK